MVLNYHLVIKDCMPKFCQRQIVEKNHMKEMNEKPPGLVLCEVTESE